MVKRRLSEIVSEEMSLDVPMPTGVWNHIDDVPRDGTPFIVRVEHSFRWAPYVDESKAPTNPKIVQRVNGKLGRWQTLDVRGNWTNCSPPEGVWR